MFRHAEGEMYSWLARNERDMADCGRMSPIKLLDTYGAWSSNVMAVHANYLARGDAAVLVARKASVVHCPRSHAYFRHDRFPFGPLDRAGVNVCLGTDSLATVACNRKNRAELNLFDEMHAFAAAHPRIPSTKIVMMATMNGARSLGLTGKAGEIRAGAFADLIAFPFTGKPEDAFDAVVDHRGPVTASMIEGQWAIVPDAAKPLLSRE